MISILTVTMNELAAYEKIFLRSVTTKLKHVKEVVIVHNNTSRSLKQSWELENGVVVKKVGFEGHPEGNAFAHAAALHYGMSHVTGDYIMFSDPDIFFYGPTDELYLRMMEIYDLAVCGISIATPPILSATFFPAVINCMMKKCDLPDSEFLKCCMRQNCMWVHNDPEMKMLTPVNGQWIMPGAVVEHWKDYPNPNGTFDTMCNLWQWCRENNRRWMSFQTMDSHSYDTALYRTNFKLRDKLTRQKILYHVNGGTSAIRANPNFIHDYERLYLQTLNEN